MWFFWASGSELWFLIYLKSRFWIYMLGQIAIYEISGSRSGLKFLIYTPAWICFVRGGSRLTSHSSLSSFASKLILLMWYSLHYMKYNKFHRSSSHVLYMSKKYLPTLYNLLYQMGTYFLVRQNIHIWSYNHTN